MAPPPAVRRCGTAARLTRYIARTLTSWARSQCSSVIVSTVPPTTIVPTPGVVEQHVEPAERPHGLVTTAAQSSGTGEIGRDRRDLTAGRAHIRDRAGQLRLARASASATRAPACANSRALARPMPVAAPVMMATLPLSAPLSAIPMTWPPSGVYTGVGR